MKHGGSQHFSSEQKVELKEESRTDSRVSAITEETNSKKGKT